MPQAIPAVIGLGTSLLGAKKAKKAADQDRALQQGVMDNLANVNFDPQSVFGPMGMGFNFDTGESSLGAFGPFQEMLGGLAESGIGQGFDIQQMAAGLGLPEMVQNFGLASGLTDQLFGDIQNFQGTQGLQDAFGGAMDFASSMFGDATAEGRDIRDMAQMFGAGGAGLQQLGLGMQGRSDFFGDQAQQGFDDLRAETLGLLRERDRAGEDRAAAGLADQLFGTGRLGTTGGQDEITAFGRGLGEADLSRQLAASQEARAAQAQQGNLANMFGGLAQGMIGQGTSLASLMPSMIGAGTGVSGLESIPLSAFSNFGQNFGMAQELENNLLNSAFNRFGSTMGLTNDLFGNMFNIGTGQIGQGSNALTSAMGMSTMPLDFAKFASNLATAQTQTDINKYGGQSNVMANFGPSGGDLMASGLSSLGNNLFTSGGGFDAITSGFKGLFNKPGQTQQVGLSGSNGGPI